MKPYGGKFAVRNFRELAGNRARWRTEAPSIQRGGNGATVHLNYGACRLLDRPMPWLAPVTKATEIPKDESVFLITIDGSFD